MPLDAGDVGHAAADAGSASAATPRTQDTDRFDTTTRERRDGRTRPTVMWPAGVHGLHDQDTRPGHRQREARSRLRRARVWRRDYPAPIAPVTIRRMTPTPAIPRDLSKLENEAAKVLSPEALAYILAGAGDRDTTRANAAAFQRWRIKRRTRRRRKPAKVDLSTTILGTRMPAPVLFAPVGVQTLAHPDGDLATARAAAELGLTYVHSTQAAYPMEEVAAANGDGSRWYQLYWPTDDELLVSFLRRARAAGYTHLVITLDTTLLGWRPLDLDRGYSPFLANEASRTTRATRSSGAGCPCRQR